MSAAEVTTVASSSGFISCLNSLSLGVSAIHPWDGCGTLWHDWGKLATCLVWEVL